MKRLLLPLAFIFFLAACNNEAGDDAATDTAAGDPATMHPPSEALPDTMQLVNDSAIVPDPSADPDVKARVGSSDSVRRERQ